MAIALTSVPPTRAAQDCTGYNAVEHVVCNLRTDRKRSDTGKASSYQSEVQGGDTYSRKCSPCGVGSPGRDEGQHNPPDQRDGEMDRDGGYKEPVGSSGSIQQQRSRGKCRFERIAACDQGMQGRRCHAYSCRDRARNDSIPHERGQLGEGFVSHLHWTIQTRTRWLSWGTAPGQHIIVTVRS